MPTLPISYIYFSWWQLWFTTQHSKYKWCYVKGDGRDRSAASKRDFKILVPERFPVPEGGRDTARGASTGEGDGGREELGTHWMWKWSCASRWETPEWADGGGLRCQSHERMAQTVSREWGNTAKQGNWEHKDGRRKSRRKAKNLSRMKKQGYVRRMRGHPPCTPSPAPGFSALILARRLDSEDCTAQRSCALCSQLVSSDGSHFEEIRGPAEGEVCFLPDSCLPGLSTLSIPTDSHSCHRLPPFLPSRMCLVTASHLC